MHLLSDNAGNTETGKQQNQVAEVFWCSQCGHSAPADDLPGDVRCRICGYKMKRGMSLPPGESISGFGRREE